MKQPNDENRFPQFCTQLVDLSTCLNILQPLPRLSEPNKLNELMTSSTSQDGGVL